MSRILAYVAAGAAVLAMTGCGGSANPGGVESVDGEQTSEDPTTPVGPLAPVKETSEEATGEETAQSDEDVAVWGYVNAPSGKTIGPIDGKDTPDCMGFLEYADIEEGMQVTILGASDNVVGLGELSMAGFDKESESCVWTFAIYATAGEGFYSASIRGWGSSDVIPEDEVGRDNMLRILPD